MALFVGLDVGSLSAKLAAVWVVGDLSAVRLLKETGIFSGPATGRSNAVVRLYCSRVPPHIRKSIQTVKDLLSEFQALLSHEEIRGMRVTVPAGGLWRKP